MPPDGTPEPAPEESLRRLGRYRIERLIGAGGAGAVFLGRDPILGRPVAVKVIPLRGVPAGEEGGDRLELLSESFRHLGSLAHPNLVTVHDAGIEGDSAYLVMELVPGQGLDEALRSGPLPRERVAQLARELAAGLDYGHRQGLVHGAVKPGNVLLPAVGQSRVADFGVAGAVAASRLGHATSLWDAPSYLAPEALDGSVTPASDQYALATLLFEATTGALPFSGKDAGEILEQVERGSPRLATALDPGLPPAVDGVFARALDKDPAARFATCSELAEALAAALAVEQATLHLFATQPLDEALRGELANAPARPAPPPVAPARRPSAVRPLLLLAAGLAGGFALGALVLREDRRTVEEGRAASPIPVGEEAAFESEEVLVGVAPVAEPEDRHEGIVTEALPPPPPAPPAAPPRSGIPPATALSPPAPVSAPTLTAPQSTTGYGTLRLRLASEVPNGRLTVLADDSVVFAERFHFGGPLAFLRQRQRGGQLEAVRQVPVRPGTLVVRVEVGEEVTVIPLRAEWAADSQHTLEVRVAADREVTATLR